MMHSCVRNIPAHYIHKHVSGFKFYSTTFDPYLLGKLLLFELVHLLAHYLVECHRSWESVIFFVVVWFLRTKPIILSDDRKRFNP